MPKPLVIDLSHYQVIPKDLHAARASGIVGVIHKATEGLRVRDAKAAARFALAREAGMLWGIYHFLRPDNIVDQAKRFLAQTDIIDDDTLLCLDFEVKGVTGEEVLEFLQYVEKNSGQKPVLYSGSYLKEIGGASKTRELADYRLWIPQYNKTGPTLPKGYKSWWLWQYSDRGGVPGIDGNVDVNAYQGTERDLQRDWVDRDESFTPQPEPAPAPEPQPEQKPDKPPPEPQVVYKEKTSAWSKVWTGVCAFFSFLWTSITGWYATDFAKPLINKARDNATNNLTMDVIPQILMLLVVVVAVGGIGLLFLWLGVWIWNHEKNRVNSLNERKVEAASDPKKATVEFTVNPHHTTAAQNGSTNLGEK